MHHGLRPVSETDEIHQDQFLSDRHRHQTLDEPESENDDGYFESSYSENPYFPIGYTIQFSPEPFHQDVDLPGSSQAARGGLGSQALPVALELSQDHDGVPLDGSEYLLLVRQEAQARPRVMTHANPYALRKSSETSKLLQSRPAPTQISPSKTWRDQFILRFNNIRKSIQSQEPWHWDLDENYRQIPANNDQSNWKIFIHGKKLNLTEYPPKPPIPLFLKALEQPTIIAILSHYQTWIQEKVHLLVALVEKNALENNSALNSKPDSPTIPQDITLLSAHDGAWLMGLLSVLDTVLTAEDVFKLRELARTCKQVAKIAEAALKLGDDPSATQEAAIAWMAVTGIADVWGQKDIWDD
ncbi:hypothetical protein O181_050147 [Austropuccinia psidii MF-1]|uniref:Gem-associated protein 2 n=1 Tax=Austropuccinia psidii MF-1 TaxID=1389203 RepID=A0A9Q3HNB1_9BASI|nr:hypothetical protein [Austropuccinia psidii MF-1]